MNPIPTYEEILEGCLNKVPSEMYRGEGSIIYDALSPAVLELAQMYLEVSNLLDLSMPDTAVGTYLDRIVSGYGLTRRQATFALRKISCDQALEIGSRWSVDETTYIIIEPMSDGNYLARCEQVGSIGNRYSGKMESLDGASDANAILIDVVESGQDIETDESLRNRFYESVQRPATSGNVHHYKIWATEVEGVGDAKIFPLWNGPGTVKVLITNTDKLPADRSLIDKVASHIEEVRPIGANVTVVAPTPKTLNINVTLEIGTDVLLETIKQNLKTKIQEYLQSITFKKNIISYAIIGSLILDVDGVIDYTDLKLNNTAANIKLTEEEIPTIGTLVVEV